MNPFKLLTTKIIRLLRIWGIAKDIYISGTNSYLKYELKLKSLVTKCSGHSWNELMANRGTRKREYVNARKVHVSLMVDFLGMGWDNSTSVYDKNHANVLNYKAKCRDHLQCDRDFVRQYGEVFDYVISKKPTLAEYYKINEKLR
jgi:hypothetical protein